MDPLASLTSALFLSYVFAGAALHKWRHMAAFESALADYRILPVRAVKAAARVLPVLEVATAAAVLIPAGSAIAAAFAALLLSAYSLAIGINLARGREAIDCGCGNPGTHPSLSSWLLLRNSLLLAAAWAAGSTITRAATWMDWTLIAPAAVTACLFYAACNQLLSNRERLKPWVLRRG